MSSTDRHEVIAHLLTDILKGSKPKPTNEKRLMKKAFDFTLEFDECAACGITWSRGDADNCENCENEAAQ
jgi:hypothetical protein